jgi:hypothetical protein
MRCARTKVGRTRIAVRHEKRKKGVYGRGIVMIFTVDEATHNTTERDPGLGSVVPGSISYHGNIFWTLRSATLLLLNSR